MHHGADRQHRTDGAGRAELEVAATTRAHGAGEVEDLGHVPERDRCGPVVRARPGGGVRDDAGRSDADDDGTDDRSPTPLRDVPPHPRGPNPLVQAPLTGWLSVIRVAVTAPVLSALPVACRHTPSLTAEAVAAAVVVYVVEPVVVTVVVVLWPPKSDCTVKPDGETAVTLPKAPKARKPPRPWPPPGCAPCVPNPLGAPDGRCPPNRPPPAVQLPFVAAVMRTVAAVISVGRGVAVAEAVSEVLGAVTVTHDPTVTADFDALTFWVNFVEAVQVTATCCCVFWTWAVEPETASTWPLAPGPKPPWAPPNPCPPPSAPAPPAPPDALFAELPQA